MTVRSVVIGLAALGMLAQPAAALTFSFSTIQGDTLNANQAAAFQAAADAWSSALSNNIVVPLQIGFANLDPSILGGSSPIIYGIDASSVKSALASHATSADDRAAVASLPNYAAGTTLTVNGAQAQALSFNVLGSDGSIEFNSNQAFSTSRSAQGTVAAGTFDLIGVAEHEIGHILGFISAIDTAGLPSTILDQFRFTAPGVRNTTRVNGSYFSLDSGTTAIAGFSPGGASNDNYQASHWAQGTGALLDPAIAPGMVENITPLDLRALDVIGFDLAASTPTSVPEPASLSILAVGLLGLVVRRRLGTAG